MFKLTYLFRWDFQIPTYFLATYNLSKSKSIGMVGSTAKPAFLYVMALHLGGGNHSPSTCLQSVVTVVLGPFRPSKIGVQYPRSRVNL